MNGLLETQRLVKSDGWAVFKIGLDENDISPALAGEMLQMPDQQCGNALPAKGFKNAEVIM